MTEGKKMVEIQMWRADRSSLEAKGRFLGLITNKQLALMIKENSFSKRVATVATMDLLELGKLDEKDVKGMRMLFVAKEIDSKEVTDPILLVSNNIDFISHVNTRENDITVNCDDSGYIIMQEVN